MGTAVRVLIAIVFAYAILRVGLAMLRMFAQPVAEPPPPGELRRVKLAYRCELCGTEVRMTAPATSGTEDMTLVTPVALDGGWRSGHADPVHRVWVRLGRVTSV